MGNKKSAIRRGSQNIFADVGSADADSHLLKAGLVSRIQDAIDDHDLTQVKAAKLMGVGQPDVSRILNGNFRDVSVERLMRFLRSLGYEIDIVVRKPGKPSSTQTIQLQPESV